MTEERKILQRIIMESIRCVLNEMPAPDTREDFERKAYLVHGNRYKYTEPFYTKSKQQVGIICPIHGYFTQRATDHLQGHGCKRCRESHLEKITDITLTNMSENFIYHATPSWLNGQHLDFFLTDYNAAIECQGIQHFQPVPFFGGEERFKRQLLLDTQKRKACEDNGVQLFYINFTDKNIPNTITNIMHSLKNNK